jgi:steroid delta-isomerase-like uncharacterized protein
MGGEPDRDSAEANAAITRRWFTEGWVSRDRALAESTFSPKFMTNGLVVGVDGPYLTIQSRLAGFPDVGTEIEEVVAAGDRVVIRILWKGTHTGPYGGVPASGKKVEVRVISMWRFEDGKVVDNWTIQDQFSLLQQIGYLPPTLTTAQGRALGDKR